VLVIDGSADRKDGTKTAHVGYQWLGRYGKTDSEQGYKQVKDELGWAVFQVRSDVAIRRHQALVNCAFSFCWDAWFHDHAAPHQPAAPRPGPSPMALP
jgi:hypothetical protein